jgi:putative endonuclease
VTESGVLWTALFTFISWLANLVCSTLGLRGSLRERAFSTRKLVPGFTQKYNVTKLVWFERHASIRAAISREKEIKSWHRAKKVALIESLNPDWNDLSLTT